MTKTLLNNPAQIIAEAAKSPLGIISLIIIVLAFLALKFFYKESRNVRIVVFCLMFIIAIFSFVLAIYPLAHPTNRPAHPEGKPVSYSAYGIEIQKTIWKHYYLENYDFKGEIEYFIKNVSSTNISILPPQQGGWFGWNVKSFELQPIIYGTDEGKHNLNRLLLSKDMIIRRDITGNDNQVTLYTWQFKIEPALAPGKTLHYGQIFKTEGTELDAFTEKGSFAGASSPFPVDTLVSEVYAPQGYRLISKGYFIRDSMGIDVATKVDEPEFSNDGSKIVWTITKPVPSLKYYLRVSIVKKT
ncbi:MAG TPA: hypothetical protein PLR60_13140 [Syntrophorhabdaceae bacterium]|nr:hypothetical protein [Syntrophorhabdaceae bacterium]